MPTKNGLIRLLPARHTSHSIAHTMNTIKLAFKGPGLYLDLFFSVLLVVLFCAMHTAPNPTSNAGDHTDSPPSMFADSPTAPDNDAGSAVPQPVLQPVLQTGAGSPTSPDHSSPVLSNDTPMPENQKGPIESAKPSKRIVRIMSVTLGLTIYCD